MSEIRRPPFYTPIPNHVVIGEWSMINGDIFQPLPSFLPQWDPAVSIRAATPVMIDYIGVLTDCHLAADARLRLTAMWESPWRMTAFGL